MPNLDLMTTEEVAAALGITRQAVLGRVKAGTLIPAFKSPAATGGYLFTSESVAGAPTRYQR